MKIYVSRNQKNQFPESFIKRAKAEYPDNDAFHRDLDKGASWLGSHFERGLEFVIDNFRDLTPKSIVEIIDKGQAQELRDKMEKIAIRQKLLDDWKEIQRKLDPLYWVSYKHVPPVC